MGKYQSHNSDICREYGETVLPDEDGNCSLCGAKLEGMAIVYSKLWSMNPDEYKEINQKEALNGYTAYLGYYVNSLIFRYEGASQTIDLCKAKTFNEWLESEI